MEEPLHPKAGLSEKAFRKQLYRILFSMGVDMDKINDMKGIELEKLKENFKDIVTHN